MRDGLSLTKSMIKKRVSQGPTEPRAFQHHFPFPPSLGGPQPVPAFPGFGGGDSFISTIASVFWETGRVFVGSLERSRKEWVLPAEHHHQPRLGCS